MGHLVPPSLADLVTHADIRRAMDLACVVTPSISTGFAALDAELPGGGWPSGCLTEIMPSHEGVGELRLFTPALARLSQEGRRLALIAPPYPPYAPAFAAQGIDLAKVIVVRPNSSVDALWAAEQCLSSGACGAALLWSEKIKYNELRRLQLACGSTTAITVLFRPYYAVTQTSPAALRITVEVGIRGLSLRLIKRRGAQLEHALNIEFFPHHVVDRDPLTLPRVRSVSFAA